MKKQTIRKFKEFTIIELIVVIIVIGILFVTFISRADNINDKAKVSGVQTDFRSFYTAVKKVGLENQLYTIPIDKFEDLLNDNLDKQLQFTDGVCQSKDPWGEPYTYATSKDVATQTFYIIFASKGGRDLVELSLEDIAKAGSDEMNIYVAMKQIGTQFYGGLTVSEDGMSAEELTEVGIYDSLREETFDKWKNILGGSLSGGSGNEGSQEPESYTITLNYNDGRSDETVTVSSVSELPVPTRDSYNFLGWYTGFTEGVLATDETLKGSNVTLYAHWESTSNYTITKTIWTGFTGEGGDNGFTTDTISYDSSKEIKPIEFECTGKATCKAHYGITKPAFVFLSFALGNWEQVPCVATPAPFSLNYEVYLDKWQDTRKPVMSNTDGEIENIQLEITQEDIDNAGGIYYIHVSARAAFYPNFPIDDLGQKYYMSYGAYELD